MHYNRREFLRVAGLGATAAAMSSLGCQSGKTAQKPNILFIMADDLGKEWIGCCGGEGTETPHIDALAAGGMRFTNAYSMAQCTPTRATLLTGQYPWRNGWINHWDVPRWGAGCHFDWRHNITFARIMKTAGYATAAAGKWQINDFRVTPDAMEKHGFDDYCMWTGYESENPPSAERYWDAYVHTREGSKTYEGRFGPDIYTDFLIDFMKQHRDEAMMLYFPMALPHGPLTTTPLDPNVKGRQETIGAMVRYVDHLVGRLVEALDDLGIRENTIVIFTTDNGSAGSVQARLNGRMVKGGKATLGEPGMNAPFIVNYPGSVPGGVVTDALLDFTDLLPTFADLGGAEISEETVVDGHSFADVLMGKTPDSSREWIMGMGYHPAKLTDRGVEPFYEFGPRVVRDKRFKIWVDEHRKTVKVFDLKNDPGESRNLVESTDPAVIRAKEKLERVVGTFSKKDGRPRYDPTPPRSWDKTIPEINEFLKRYYPKKI